MKGDECEAFWIYKGIPQTTDINLFPEKVHHVIIVVVGVFWPMAAKQRLACGRKTFAHFLQHCCHEWRFPGYPERRCNFQEITWALAVMRVQMAQPLSPPNVLASLLWHRP